MEAKHTPGPWAFRDFGGELFLIAEHGRRSVVLGGSRGSVKGLVQNGDDGVLARFNPESPDAKLIESAPRLAQEHAEMRKLLESGILAMTGRRRADWADNVRALLAKFNRGAP